MTTKGERRRGQPLVVLAALLLGWAGARLTSVGGEGGPSLPEVVLTATTASAAQTEQKLYTAAGPQTYAGFAMEHALPMAASMPAPMAMPMPAIQYVPVVYMMERGRTRYEPTPVDGAGQLAQIGRASTFPSSTASYIPADFSGSSPLNGRHREDTVLTPGLPPLFSVGTPPTQYGEPSTIMGGRIGRLLGNPARWSMDAWSLTRKSADRTPTLGTLPSVYGASQTGAVVRYKLSMKHPNQPTAYLRTTSTVGGLRETTMAVGLSAKPMAQLPLVAAVEGRMTQQSAERRIQPAVMAITTIPPVPLSGGFRAEIYGQGGYVAGRYATPFADGQMRVDRALVDVGSVQARIGAGAWGGIQKGASRLDVGPGASLSMPLTSKVFGRLSVDWRLKVAGNAEPDSGPAMTVAAGF